jgi:vacuolar-type H+-ATPase subunit H
VRRDASETPSGAEALIAGVLAAEREARAAAAQCEQQAQEIVAAARAQATHIAERTEQRILRLQQRMASTTQARLDEIAAAVAALGDHSPDPTALLAHADKAIAALADELVGRKT